MPLEEAGAHVLVGPIGGRVQALGAQTLRDGARRKEPSRGNEANPWRVRRQDMKVTR